MEDHRESETPDRAPNRARSPTSMSVKRNVTVPDGTEVMRAEPDPIQRHSLGAGFPANELSPSNLIS
jgi:hypothetical protein